MSTDDLMSLVRSSPPSPPLQVGAVLLLEVGAGFDPARFRCELDRRLPGVPRLRQRLLEVPWGCGRPVWVDDPGFRIERHLACVPGDAHLSSADILQLAAELVTTPLPADRPLWAARLVPVDQHRAALIMVFHHVLADGMAGLAILARLVDGAERTVDADFPGSPPARRTLAADCARERLRWLLHLPRSIKRLAGAMAQLAPAATGRAQRSSLNQPTGPGRRVDVVATELDRVQETAHHLGVTVNDLVLAAVARALHRLLAARGEQVTGFVVSIPFSARVRAETPELGNQSGVVPLLISAGGAWEDQAVSVARVTRQAKQSPLGASTAVLAPLFRLLAAVGLYGRFVDHQRVIHTFVSNLRGPSAALNLIGCPISDVIPLSFAVGNVTVSFSVLSYAGTLTVTVSSDPATCPDVALLCVALVEELHRATTSPVSSGCPSFPHRS